MRRSWSPAILAVGLVLLSGMALAIHPAPVSAAGVPFSSLTLAYEDSHGPGTATLVNQGSDAASGGSLLTVTINQSGRTLRGQGFAQQTEAYVLSFWLSDGAGNTYFFEGVLSFALNRWSARGTWQDVQAPQQTDQWSMSMPTPPVAAS